VKEISGNRIDRARPRPPTDRDERRQASETFGGHDDVQRARWFAVAAVEQWGHGRSLDVLALVVTELVTNAVVHGGGSCVLRLEPGSGHVLVEVADSTSLVPAVRATDPDREQGRGMLLVDAMTAAWGVDVSPAGKVVWAQVPC
jgi:anti-sigma regulatory factor (Ser/Thr protein kinase)